MILVKIELHSAITGKITQLGQMQICNTGHATKENPKRGDYEISLFRKGSTTKVQRQGLVRDYPRQSYTVWELVRRALECTLGKWPVHPGHPVEFDEDIASFYEKPSQHWDTPQQCSECGKPTRPNTAGCDHCDLEDK